MPKNSSFFSAHNLIIMCLRNKRFDRGFSIDRTRVVETLAGSKPRDLNSFWHGLDYSRVESGIS